MTSCTAIACRYGWQCYHDILLYEGEDLEAAIVCAMHYHRRRGGKYSVLVKCHYGWGEGSTLYLSSSRCEPAPEPMPKSVTAP